MIEMLECTAPDGARTGARVARPPRTARGTLVLVHGVGSTAAIWDRQLAAFRDDYLCAAVELRGNGTLPDPDPGSITRQGYAADVLAVADALGAERFTIAGCSLGGVVAFELWQRAAWRIDAMFILGSFARYPDGQRYADSICAQARELGDVRAFGELRAAQLGLPPERLRETIDQYA
ncbi:MAG: alpha/beta fold hydrolase, partial [Candidatus Eremiobacteraeota bacterium]|nr:alpha/beta fold hydrolase [Candidatus Eremiobacteraeota bacterium]